MVDGGGGHIASFHGDRSLAGVSVPVFVVGLRERQSFPGENSDLATLASRKRDADLGELLTEDRLSYRVTNAGERGLVAELQVVT